MPLGNGTLFLGVVFGLEYLLASGMIEKMLKVIAIQSEHCAPFAEAVKQGLKSDH